VKEEIPGTRPISSSVGCYAELAPDKVLNNTFCRHPYVDDSKMAKKKQKFKVNKVTLWA
jgi:hypothetical protein